MSANFDVKHTHAVLNTSQSSFGHISPSLHQWCTRDTEQQNSKQTGNLNKSLNRDIQPNTTSLFDNRGKLSVKKYMYTMYASKTVRQNKIFSPESGGSTYTKQFRKDDTSIGTHMVDA